jgi:hypothetical protein
LRTCVPIRPAFPLEIHQERSWPVDLCGVHGHQELDRWFGVGHSSQEDPAAAGAEAVAAAVGDRAAALVLVFCSAVEDHERLLDSIRSGVGDRAVIAGCSSFGQLAGAVLNPRVSVVAVGGAGIQVRSQVARNASADRRGAGIEIGGSLDGITHPNRACLMLADGLIGEQHELVRGAYSVLGAAVPLIGGCSADEIIYGRTHQFHGDARGVEVLSDSVIGIGLGSTGPLGIGIAHGWRKVGEPLLVTGSSGGRVRELDEEPAALVYLRRLGIEPSQLGAGGSGGRELVMRHPLGLSRRTGEDIRVIHGVDAGTGEIVCLADVPQGALAWLMETDPESLILGAKESLSQAIAGLAGAAPIGVLAFDCGARRVMLGDDGLRQEVDAMSAVLGDVPVGGFYTYGEIARTHGARGMHHLTVASLAFG